MVRKVHLLIVGALLAVALAVPQVALAAQPDSANCWGEVTSQRATALHDIGEHSSAQAEPRLGLGNLAHLLGFDTPGELGAFLGELDGIAATNCS
jgi:hypothetical protein